MKLYSWNVNGIRSVAQKGLLAWMRVAQPDVLCVQETKAHVEQLDAELVRPLGYHAYWHSGVRRGYSGVATFTREEPQSVVVGLGIPEFDDEGRVLMTEFLEFPVSSQYGRDARAVTHRQGARRPADQGHDPSTTSDAACAPQSRVPAGCGETAPSAALLLLAVPQRVRLRRRALPLAWFGRNAATLG